MLSELGAKMHFTGLPKNKRNNVGISPFTRASAKSNWSIEQPPETRDTFIKAMIEDQTEGTPCPSRDANF
ncbi:transcriptional regulator, XRE family [Alicyclobacillus hesperidum URH17-3-68]|uniref:Uncharacterized protein n=1 Tax=Alicyclobacillus hesperidum TaxID=89784 RepID=A0AA37U449_9BACL|nr:transcriptional regulator, XRE family [Alicyclobacillus hesperidum URH17-3-68]GLV13245.1 hypothetical protein Heshes_09290 [Alicyclobacillus hesperidum]